MKRRRARNRSQHTAAWLLTVVGLYFASAVIGVLTALQAGDARALFRELLASQASQDEHRREYRLLRLELATLAGFQNVERVARETLDMHFPEQVVRVERDGARTP